MFHRPLLCFFACALLLTTARADILPPQFDAAVPPATPAGDIDFPTQVPVGKTLLIPVAASNPNGGAVIYSASSSNTNVMVRVRTGNPILNLTVDHPAYSGTDFAGTDLAVSGTLQLMLFREFTPMTAGIIAGLAQGGFYDNVIFHRIIPNFMIQGGDPSGTGSGDPGFDPFANEFKLPLIFTGKGQLAMANSGFNSGWGSNGSQFFITDSLPRHLDFNHTIFGQLVRGWDVLYNLSQVATSGTTDPDQGKWNRPLSSPVITSASITKSNDAVLFLSASGTGSATISVNISDVSTGVPITSSTQFTVTAVVDRTNDPVVITPVSDALANFQKQATVVLQAQDLEYDAIGYGGILLGSSTDQGIITTNAAGNKLQIGGRLKDSFTGYIGVAGYATQLNASYRGSQGVPPPDYSAFYVGIGDRVLTPQPVNLTLSSGTIPQTIIAASFLDKDSSATTAAYLGAKIFWGDGIQTDGTISKDPNAGRSARFLVSGSHAYANPGIYSLRVRVYGNLGATAHINGVVNVTDGTVFASGLTLSSNGGIITKKQVASFIDQTPLATGSYQTLIDWGDGVSSAGSVAKLSGSTAFKVIGSHRYTDSANYPVNVTIIKNAETATAWSIAQVSRINKAPFLPPFPQRVHLTPSFDFATTTYVPTSGTGSYLAISGTMTIRNTGTKKSSPAALRFVTSNDGINATAVPYHNQLTLTVPAINAGGQVQIPFLAAKSSLLIFPQDLTSAPDFYKSTAFYFRVEWSDTLADQEPIQRWFGYYLYQ